MQQNTQQIQANSKGLFSRLGGVFKKTQKKSSLNMAQGSGWANPVAYYYAPGKPVWKSRRYQNFAEEGYIKNVVANRCIQLIANNAASVQLKLMRSVKGQDVEVKQHPILDLLRHPNPCMGRFGLFSSLMTHQLISGNAYVQLLRDGAGAPAELFVLRPDRMTVVAGRGCFPSAYLYQVGDKERRFAVDHMSGRADILHIKNHHPLNDWYGLSAFEAAAYAIDQHNQAGEWNQSLLQNGARPSGALVVKGEDGKGGYLSDDQYSRLKNQLSDEYSGAMNAGRPILLEGGLEWHEMSLSPKDMDFLNVKHSAARDIALAFGVPPQMLGIPGDNTYSNYKEARNAFWEETILPLLTQLLDGFNHWLLPEFSGRTGSLELVIGENLEEGGEK